MAARSEELKQRMIQLRERLRGAGAKLTPQRLEIFREVARSGDHPDVEAVYRRVRERVPTVSLDTVYRTLWLLLDLGLIGTLGRPRERVRFDGNTSPHHHFVCTECGMARDFTSEELDQLEIPRAVKAMGRIERAQVEFNGVCSPCWKRREKLRRRDSGAGRR